MALPPPDDLALEPALFYCPEESVISVRPDIAVSRSHSSEKRNFALIGTPLKADCALVVELTALKQKAPVQIVLTTEYPDRAYSSDSLPQLCETFSSPTIESEVPENFDEVGVRISSDGSVSISHNNHEWIKRIEVDRDSNYHVIFSMEHVSVLSLVGIASGLAARNQETIDASVSCPF